MLDGGSELLDVAGRHEPSAAPIDEFWNSRNVSCDDRAAERHGFHQDDRQPLGKTRKDERSRSTYQRKHLAIRLPTSEFDLPIQPELADSALEFRPQRPVAGYRHPELNALPGQDRERVDENELAFLLAQTAYGHELSFGNVARWPLSEEVRIEPTSDQLDLRPLLRRNPTADLAAGEGTHHAD